MKYIPLRIHSVFSRGKGAVDAGGLVQQLKPQGINFLPVCDPFSITGWENFRQTALEHNMKPLLGMEIRLQDSGSMLLFPTSNNGFYSLLSSFNKKAFSRMEDTVAIFIPTKGRFSSPGAMANLKEQVPTGHFFLGLEWDTPRGLVEIAKKINAPLVWAQPLRWLKTYEKYAVTSAVFLHRHLPEILKDAERNKSLNPFGPINGAAVLKRWADTGRQALENTLVIPGMIHFDFSGLANARLGRALPGKPEPNQRLEEIVKHQLHSRKPNTAEQQRTFRELKIIQDLGYAPYFLIASAIAAYCREKGIYFNLRGSGGSSFILYLLGLSKVNPLHFNLLFERFVNSLRQDLPDIDIDFDSSRRHEVLRWVFEKYKDRVAFVSSHKFFRARSALYEVARCSGYNPEEAHKMSKELPMFTAPSELAAKARGYEPISRLYAHAALLDGVYKELSLHAGGVVFSSGPVAQSFPLEKSPQGFPQVIWDKDTIERLQIFKLDLLGVRGFDVISDAALTHEKDFDFQDAGVWERIRSARTIGCFQLESPLAREHLQKVQPRDLGQLAVSVAIIRPGPAKSGMKEAYIENRPPLHPILAKIFPHTRGALIFEEQITLLLHTVSGWDMEFSEIVRKSLKKQEGEKYRDDFFARGCQNGWKEPELRQFWQLAADFSLYAFNQAHSIAYGYSAYISAWLKTKQPVTFFCRLFNSGGGYYPLLTYIEEAQKNGIELLPPDINHSRIGFSRENGAIRTGFYFIKGIGRVLAEKILNQRGTGYNNIEDFIARTRLGEKEISILMAVAAFQSLGYNGYTQSEMIKNWKNYLGFVPNPRPAPNMNPLPGQQAKVA